VFPTPLDCGNPLQSARAARTQLIALVPMALPVSIALGRPRLHLRCTTSTSDRARELALGGAPHGTLVTASEQTAGRGRQGRRWSAPAGSSLLMSLVLRGAPEPLSLLVAVAVCDVVGDQALVKWPNDIVAVEGLALKKLAGILIEGRPQEGWLVLGIGLNVAVRVEDMPVELRETVATLGQASDAIEPTLERLLVALERRLSVPVEETLEEWRELDALRGREVSWGESPGHEELGHQGQSGQEGDAEGGHGRLHGRAEGIDDAGRLIVWQSGSRATALNAGEVHLRDGSARLRPL
jgi:BirA family biotin operon repressor/biotin-[acetyl-CoA-carboxylase] ligase